MWHGSSVDTVKLGNTLKNMGNVLAKIVQNSIFSKMKLTGLLMKKRASFPSKICPVFSEHIFSWYLKFHAFSILAAQLISRWAVKYRRHETLAEHWLNMG